MPRIRTHVHTVKSIYMREVSQNDAQASTRGIAASSVVENVGFPRVGRSALNLPTLGISSWKLRLLLLLLLLVQDTQRALSPRWGSLVYGL